MLRNQKLTLSMASHISRKILKLHFFGFTRKPNSVKGETFHEFELKSVSFHPYRHLQGWQWLTARLYLMPKHLPRLILSLASLQKPKQAEPAWATLRDTASETKTVLLIQHWTILKFVISAKKTCFWHQVMNCWPNITHGLTSRYLTKPAPAAFLTKTQPGPKKFHLEQMCLSFAAVAQITRLYKVLR